MQIIFILLNKIIITNENKNPFLRFPFRFVVLNLERPKLKWRQERG